jgi:capsid protein
LPWGLRALLERPLTPEQELLTVLAHDGEPRLRAWARTHREHVRGPSDLLAELRRLQARGPAARSLAAAIWLAWRDFGGHRGAGRDVAGDPERHRTRGPPPRLIVDRSAAQYGR